MKSRGVLIAGNWKMNHGLVETREFFRLMRETGPSLDAVEKLRSARLRAWAFPPMTSLQTAEAEIQNLVFPFRIGAQNVHWEKSGAFTGEISGPMLTELGIGRALTGHSERRQHFGETNETVRKRTESLLRQDFQVILCVGETRAEREAGKTFAVVEEQLRAAFGIVDTSVSPIAEYLDGRLIIAYEPVWAIGTGLTATPAQAEEAHAMIRDFLSKRLGAEVAAKTPVLYGGSVTPENADSLLACANIDGALVGGASLKAKGFISLLEAGARALG
jgi:triosephosphate isomerase (TIM)